MSHVSFLVLQFSQTVVHNILRCVVAIISVCISLLLIINEIIQYMYDRSKLNWIKINLSALENCQIMDEWDEASWLEVCNKLKCSFNSLNTKPKLCSGLDVCSIEPRQSLTQVLVFYITRICTWHELVLWNSGNVNLINFIVKKWKICVVF